MLCYVMSARRLGNLTECARKPSQNFQNTMLIRHVRLVAHKVAFQGPEIRKSFEEARKKGETK